ncbi:hypothetical protein E2I00_017862 [Balaenoptera physalus]|uniref:Uncharacterized protein n=1 Tax=Balaenoptera physalus TaxID=9770 RepID=A0A643CIX9_BALPH|nr:hypothetical protein E2I00_017862 [Balaenoptera physalus]
MIFFEKVFFFHPLKLSEIKFPAQPRQNEFFCTEKLWGLFAPLKLQMEFRAMQHSSIYYNFVYTTLKVLTH